MVTIVKQDGHENTLFSGVSSTDETIANFCHLTFQTSSFPISLVRVRTLTRMKLESSVIALLPFRNTKQCLISVRETDRVPGLCSIDSKNSPDFATQ